MNITLLLTFLMGFKLRYAYYIKCIKWYINQCFLLFCDIFNSSVCVCARPHVCVLLSEGEKEHKFFEIIISVT